MYKKRLHGPSLYCIFYRPPNEWPILIKCNCVLNTDWSIYLLATFFHLENCSCGYKQDENIVRALILVEEMPVI